MPPRDLSQGTRVGVHIEFTGQEIGGPDTVTEIAHRVEDLGFHELWVGEHVAYFPRYRSRHPSSADGRHPATRRGTVPSRYDPFLLLTHIGAVTRRLRLGTAVALLPQRHPLTVAKIVATLDQFSRGRFDFGVGIGWASEEFDALSLPFADRGRRYDESLAALLALWDAAETTAYEGDHVRFRDVISFPKPYVRPYRNMFIGGKGPRSLDRARRFGLGWLPSNIRIDELRRSLASAHPPPVVALYFPPGGWITNPGALDVPEETITQTRQYVEQCVELGVDQVAIKVDIGRGELDQLERFAAALAPFLATPASTH